jgi:S-(hydroxymethyl)glutathione dehydrogenase/alcohol dehydrogenase
LHPGRGVGRLPVGDQRFVGRDHRSGGTVTLVGAAGVDESVTFPALSLMADGKTIRGSVYGASDPARDIPVLAELACRGRLDLEALVTRRIGIDDVEAAFGDMTAGYGARSVVRFAAPA